MASSPSGPTWPHLVALYGLVLVLFAVCVVEGWALLRLQGTVDALQVARARETDLDLVRAIRQESLRAQVLGRADAQGTADANTTSEPQVLEADVVRAALEDPNALAGLARVVPHLGPDSAPDGFRLYAIRRGTLLERMGFKNGDTLYRVNGLPLNSATSALEAYTSLQQESRIRFDIERRGEPMSLEFEIR